MKTILSIVLTLFSIATVSAQCNASFTWDDTDITIQFMDTSTSPDDDPIVSWFWDFDDDGNTSTQQNPLYTFSRADKYDVVLTITTQNGCISTIEIEIETCVLDVQHTIGSCDASGNIPVMISVNDPWDVADEIDIILDGSSIPGSPFPIDIDNPVTTTVTVPGNGLPHSILIQSTDIATCGRTIDFTVPDCNSNCFLSSFQVNYPEGTIHTVNVGDDFFSPVSTGVVLGDIVHFNWIGDGHSTTSDITSGPDAWNSGVISIGSTFDVAIENPGTHPYYCIPHGNPGGVGMSGTILANCPTGNSLDVLLSFNASIADAQGYNVYYDAVLVPGSPFSYNGVGPQQLTISIAGDGMAHPILIEDVADPTCTLSMNYDAPDCGQGGGDPVCSLSINLGPPSGCDANQEVTVNATVSVANGGNGFNLSIDNGPTTFYPYDGPNNSITITLPGDGQNHDISIVDDMDATCTATTNIITPDCNLPCNITNLTAVSGGGSGGGITHTVNVEDFIFNPSIVNITVGNQVEWVWTGVIAHTTTSDATSGPDSWDSGLLNNGDTYLSPILSEGSHPYYCIPHGDPGGVGMAGTIFVLPPCNDQNEVMVNVSFDVTSNGTNGFEILIDGLSSGVFPYVAGSAQSATIQVIGDLLSHTIEVRDVDTPTCTASVDIITPDCNGGGNPICSIDLTAAVTGTCDGAGNVPVELSITASDQSDQFIVNVDGNEIGSFPYTGSNTSIIIQIPGDNQNHSITVTDELDPACTSNTTIITPDCSLPCSISNLTAEAGGGSGGGITHTVNVEDFIFNPSIVNITAGDQVEWVWTGAIAHTATSDATSGTDSWDSGLLNNGDTYLSPVLTEGSHPYYCIPHGDVGGVGMAGTIFVLPPCNDQDEVMVYISFDVSGPGGNGFEVFVDGFSAGVFPYEAGNTQNATIQVLGDLASHTIEVKDIDTPTCTASIDIITPDCNGGGNPVCSIDVSATVNGSCDAAGNVPVELTITASDQSDQFIVNVDGNEIGSFPYTGSNTTIIIQIPGDNQSHSITVTDELDPACANNTTLITPDCSLPCSISNLTAQAGGGSGGGITHTVNVEDFIFNPSIVNITVGDQVEWVWTGVIAHTATSDATSGTDSWDSGLLNNGDTYLSPVLTEGSHPYYCIPHGDVGGVGMAGTIFVLPPCNDQDEVLVNVSFDVDGPGSNGFEILVDGLSVGVFPYVAGMAQSATIEVIGDLSSHSIEVKDLDTPSCSASVDVITPDCNGGGNPVCSISLASVVNGPCDSNGNIPVELTITASDQSAQFIINVDGNEIGTFPYTGSFTTYTIQIPGDNQSHTITVTDSQDSSCSDVNMITTSDCQSGCEINDITLTFGQNTTHIILVEDFQFTPDSINVTLGDTILFDWTGQIPHTATSDVSGGANSFDSGLLSQGSTFSVIMNSSGNHPYYCIPHGAPGGIGMAGNISVSSACDGAFALANLSVGSNGSSGQGFNLFLDGILMPESPVPFQATGNSTAAISVPGDQMNHQLIIADVGNPSCKDSITFLTPLCNADSCQTSITNISFEDCTDATTLMTIDFTSMGSNQDHHIYYNGILLNASPVSTDNSGMGSFSASISGNGQMAEIAVANILTPTCNDTLSVLTPDCNVVCLISDFEIGNGAGLHIVEVRDFDFFPAALDVLIGDTVRFSWTGQIPHTTTSDAVTGADVWDSGLFGEGHSYDVIIETPGEHPYYCIPHGGPGGIGMAGSITVSDNCVGTQWYTNYSFNVSAGSPLGYNLFVDGVQWNPIPITYQQLIGINTGVVSMPGDGMAHTITIQDIETDFCAFTSSITSNLCGPSCAINNLKANIGSNVIHEIEVRDYDFFPQELELRAGETVRFIWTGNIPHTSTSDALSGVDSWDSGLRTQGDTFDIIIQSPGDHPFYCIPHGGPGGIGQSGTLFVLPQCQEGNQELHIEFDAFGGSPQGYKLYVDGTLNGGLHAYDNVNGFNNLNLLVPADDQQHIVTIQDDNDPVCAASAFYEADVCPAACELGGLQYQLIKNKHIVDVRDFDFLPLDLTVEAGDTILFNWTGAIPHTVTSDVQGNPSSFNSGLLQQGESWTLILEQAGDHPYYCIPHGGPGGIGMAGNITVVDACDNNEVMSLFTFTSSKLSGTYNVTLNGSMVIAGMSYSGLPQNSFSIPIPANNTTLNIQVQDAIDATCSTSLTIPPLDCNDPCFSVRADYNYNINFASMEVEFTDQSIGNIVSWNWDFGDGTSSTVQNPTHTFADTLTYEVCLTIMDDQNCESSYCDIVRFSDAVCIAGFTYDQHDLQFTFYNTSDFEDPNTEILWTFGDGTISTEMDSAHHTFTLGSYQVCIQISSNDCDTSYCEVIDLLDPCLTITPDFSVTTQGTSLRVQFTDISSGSPDSWLWGFGDGQTSSEQNPVYTFESIGTYNICLFVQENENACSKTICKTIDVGTTSVLEVEDFQTLSLYPNPVRVKDEIYVKGFNERDIGHDAVFKIFDSKGRVLMNSKVIIDQKMVFGNLLSAGHYYLMIQGRTNSYRGMFIKQ